MRTHGHRTEETKKWRIPNKFINADFVSFLSVLFPLENSNEAKDQRPITGDGSLQEWVENYQLQILHTIVLSDVLKLLNETGTAKIHEKENYIQYSSRKIACLIAEIDARRSHAVSSLDSSSAPYGSKLG